MNGDWFARLAGRDTLMAAGVTLVMAGIILRGFARNYRRDLARRKQHLLDERRTEGAGRGGEMEAEPGWLARNFGHVANAVLLAGIALWLVAALRD